MVDYKLRLGDGTTFSVDEKGLTTWLQGGLVDDKARVQPAGSKKWFTLKQVLAAQGQQRGHADRQTEKGRADVDRQAAAEVAEIEKRVAEQRAAEEKKAADELAAAERKAAEDRTAAERKLIEDREAAERYVAEEKAEEEARAAAERAEAEAREAARVAEAEQRVAAERAERADRKRKAEEERLEAEARAAEQERLEEDRAAAARQAAAERKAAAEQEAAERREAEAREAAAREAERVAEAERLVAAERSERAERKRRADAEAKRLAEEQRAEEQRAAEQRAEEQRALEQRVAEQRAAERLAAERRAAERRAAEEQAEREREAAALAASAGLSPDPPETAIAVEPAATMVKVEDFQRELGLVPVVFDEAAGGPGPGRERLAVPSAAASRAAITSDDTDAPGRDAASAAGAPTAVVGALIKVFRVIERMVTWVAAIAARRSARPAAPEAGAESFADAAVAPPPVAPPPAAVAPRPVPVASAPVTAPKATTAAAKPAVSAPPPWAAPPPAPWAPPGKTGPATPAAKAPPRQPATPPPSFHKMDVIPFAPAPAAPKVDDDMWEGEDPYAEPSAVASAFGMAWTWVKRITIAVALVTGVALLALNKDKWVPQAQDAATVLGQGVDKLSERASGRTVPPQEIEAARAAIPYLRAQTIELVLSKTSAALEPAEVFRRAHVAAERGRASLPDNVVAEIDKLTAAVVAGIDDATEREHLKAYLAALRAGTATADYEDKEAVWLMARGARRLSPEEISRMEELLAQAVAAGFPPAGVRPPSS